MLLAFNLFAQRRVLTVMPNEAAIDEALSPELTTYLIISLRLFAEVIVVIGERATKRESP